MEHIPYSASIKPGRSLASRIAIDFIIRPSILSTGVPSSLITESWRVEESGEDPVLTDKTVAAERAVTYATNNVPSSYGEVVTVSYTHLTLPTNREV